MGTYRRLKLQWRASIVLTLSILIINVPPWLLFKGNTISFVCALDAPAPNTGQQSFAGLEKEVLPKDNVNPDRPSMGADDQGVLETDLQRQPVNDNDLPIELAVKNQRHQQQHQHQHQQQQQQRPLLSEPEVPIAQASLIVADLAEDGTLIDTQDIVHGKEENNNGNSTQPQAPPPTDTNSTPPLPSATEKPVETIETDPDESSQPPTPAVPSQRRLVHTYYVELSAQAGTEEAKVQHQVVVQALQHLPGDGKITIRHEFGMDEDDVLNVISFKIEGDSEGLEAIAKMEGVVGIYPVRTRKRPKALPLGALTLTRPSLEAAHVLTGVRMAQQKLGLTGKGIKVGIIDTGVDYKHPALGGCFGPGCKVAFGYDFVGDDYDNVNPDKDTPKPDGDPMDCAGHGTHVAGIVAARNTGQSAMGEQDFVGVAPDVTLGAYRVFGCDGEVSDDVLLAALKRAYRDGMDIVNLSLGGSSGWPEEPFAIACNAYIQKGLHISIANGNDGEQGLFEDGAPATAAGAIAVGSVDNTHFLGPAASISWKRVSNQGLAADDETGNGGSPFMIGMAMGADAGDVPMVSFSSDIPYVVYVPSSNPLGCSVIDLNALDRECQVPRQHVIVLFRRGSCTFSDKAKNVANARLGGMLVYDVIPEQRPLGMAIIGYNISAAGLSFEDATQVLDALKDRPNGGPIKLTAQFMDKNQVLKLASGGKISDFSSWGPDARLRYKPDIIAPGGMIYSTFPLAKGGFTTLQGTSMASPYMAGIQALYLSKYGKTDPFLLLNILQSTAMPTIRPGSTTGLTSAFQQGGGLISMEKLFSDKQPTIVSPTALFLNDTQFQRLDHTVTFTNPSISDYRTWTMVHRPALSINGFDNEHHFIPVNQSEIQYSEKGVDSVGMSPSRFELPPGGKASVQIRFEPPRNLNPEERWLFSGYLEFLCQSQDGSHCESSIISYGGMHGRLVGIPILNPALRYPILKFDRESASGMRKAANVGSSVRPNSDVSSQEEGEEGQGETQNQDRQQRQRRHKSSQHDPSQLVQRDLPDVEWLKAKRKPRKRPAPRPKPVGERKDRYTVGHDEQDWVEVMISVNFPTSLLTIEVESVCPNDHGKGDGGNRVRLELEGGADLGASRFQIESEGTLEEAEQVVQQQTQQTSTVHKDPLEEALVDLMRHRLERSRELAYMPSGLYMPYKGYSQVMSSQVLGGLSRMEVDIPLMLRRKAKKIVAKVRKGRRGKKALPKKMQRRPKKKAAPKKGSSKKMPSKKKQHPQHVVQTKKKSGAKKPAGRLAKAKKQAVACVPRILGLIPDGFNPWSTRTDSGEGNDIQTFPWMGDLLLENPATKSKLEIPYHLMGADERSGAPWFTYAKKRKGPKKPSKGKAQESGISESGGTKDLPDGRYRLVVKVLKPWGVPGRASDVERWSSPIITIRRK